MTDIVIEISKKLDVEIRRSDISIAHRLPPKKFKANDSASRPPTLIAQFTNKRVRNEIFAKRKKAKEMTDFPVDKMIKLYINKNLRQFRKRLFWSNCQSKKIQILLDNKRTNMNKEKRIRRCNSNTLRGRPRQSLMLIKLPFRT